MHLDVSTNAIHSQSEVERLKANTALRELFLHSNPFLKTKS